MMILSFQLLVLLLWGPPSFAAELDVDISQYHVIPDRGVVLERFGTIFAHPQLKIMTAVITLDRLELTTDCNSELQSVLDDFNTQMTKYRQMTEAVFEAQRIFTSREVCRILRGQEHSSSICKENGRQKRLASVGAYIMSGVAMSMAVTAIGMASNNLVEINKIKNYVEQNQESIAELQGTLMTVKERQDSIIDTQRSLLGYVQEMTKTIDTLTERLTCVTKLVYFQNWANELRREIENILQFILLGQTYGRLNPKLINPSKLRQFLQRSSSITSVILSDYPNILYQTGMATLIDANFKQLQFTFLITYPDFDRNPIYPHYQVHQIGFFAKLPDPSPERDCFMFSMPSSVVIHNSTLSALLQPLNCPSFGNVKICSSTQFHLFPLQDCLRVNAENMSDESISSYINCPLFKCFGTKPTAYTSTAGGILLRTQSKTVDVIHDRTNTGLDLYTSGTKTTIHVGESGAIFIPWTKNVSSIVFDNEVVYSPINAQNFAHIKISPHNSLAKLDNSSLFAIPLLGTSKLSSIIQKQEERLEELEKGFKPSIVSLKDWVSSKFSLPLWLKISLWTTCAIVILILIKYLYTKICTKCPVCIVTTNAANNAQYEQIPQNLTRNQLYPSITTLLRQVATNNDRTTTNSPQEFPIASGSQITEVYDMPNNLPAVQLVPSTPTTTTERFGYLNLRQTR